MKARSLSEVPATIPLMGTDEETLTRWLHGGGFTVVEFGSGPWGFTDYAAREVGLRQNLRTFQRVPVLLHECWHVHLGHTGHQDAATENWINEQVAMTLVAPEDYAHWEAQFGYHTGGIAHAMELPRWVIEAYRRVLKRELLRL